MSITRYAFITSYLKGGEAKNVNSSHIARLAKTPALHDVLTGINGTEMGDYLEKVTLETFDQADEHLWGYLGHCAGRVESLRFIPDDILTAMRAYLKKYDVHNLKTALHQIYSGKKTRMIPLGTIHQYRLLDRLADAETLDHIIEVVNSSGLTDYIPILQGYRSEDARRSSLSVGAGLDMAYYAELMKVADKLKDGFILNKALGVMIDLTNLLVALRATGSGIGTDAVDSIIPTGHLLSAADIRELLAGKITDIAAKISNPVYREIVEEAVSNYTRNQEIAAVTETFDRHKANLVRGLLSARVMSPLIVIWYFFAKEAEIRNMRLVLKAVYDQQPVDEIKDNLVFVS